MAAAANAKAAAGRMAYENAKYDQATLEEFKIESLDLEASKWKDEHTPARDKQKGKRGRDQKKVEVINPKAARGKEGGEAAAGSAAGSARVLFMPWCFSAIRSPTDVDACRKLVMMVTLSRLAQLALNSAIVAMSVLVLKTMERPVVIQGANNSEARGTLLWMMSLSGLLALVSLLLVLMGTSLLRGWGNDPGRFTLAAVYADVAQSYLQATAFASGVTVLTSTIGELTTQGAPFSAALACTFCAALAAGFAAMLSYALFKNIHLLGR
jgi:hypothetical protein